MYFFSLLGKKSEAVAAAADRALSSFNLLKQANRKTRRITSSHKGTSYKLLNRSNYKNSLAGATFDKPIVGLYPYLIFILELNTKTGQTWPTFNLLKEVKFRGPSLKLQTSGYQIKQSSVT